MPLTNPDPCGPSVGRRPAGPCSPYVRPEEPLLPPRHPAQELSPPRNCRLTQTQPHVPSYVFKANGPQKPWASPASCGEKVSLSPPRDVQSTSLFPNVSPGPDRRGIFFFLFFLVGLFEKLKDSDRRSKLGPFPLVIMPISSWLARVGPVHCKRVSVVCDPCPPNPATPQSVQVRKKQPSSFVLFYMLKEKKKVTVFDRGLA